MARTKIPTFYRTPVRKVILDSLEILERWDVLYFRLNVGDVTVMTYNGMSRKLRQAPKSAPNVVGVCPWDGRFLALEFVRYGFQPHETPLSYLREINASGGVGLWVTESRELENALELMKKGYRVEIDEKGFCVMTNEPQSKNSICPENGAATDTDSPSRAGTL